MNAIEFQLLNLTSAEFVAIIKNKTNELPVVGETDLFGHVVTQGDRDLALNRLGSFVAGVIGRVIA